MKIDKNKVVTFTYEMMILDEEGSSNQQVDKSKPLHILMGYGSLLEPFEAQLLGLEKDESFEFTLSSEQTFGAYMAEAIHAFDKEELLKEADFSEDDIEAGMYLPMETDEGTPFNAKIVDISDEKIMLDFNHPLAGKDLVFKGEIQDVREATPDELQARKYLPPLNEKTDKQ